MAGALALATASRVPPSIAATLVAAAATGIREGIAARKDKPE